MVRGIGRCEGACQFSLEAVESLPFRALLVAPRVVGALIGGETAERLSGLLDSLTAPGQLAEAGDWIIECETGADLLDRAARVKGRGNHL